MKKMVVAFVLVSAVIVGIFALALGSSGFLSDFRATYTATTLNSCSICHTSAPNLNPYGQAWLDSGLDFAAIEALDSDGDGFSNIAEIRANTFPGNAASHPAPAVNLSTAILWRNTTTGQNSAWTMSGAAVTGMVDLPSVSNQAWTIVGTGDFNGDGNTDVLWRNNTTGQNSVWYMAGAAVSSIADIPNLGNMSWTIGGTGDFNGDAKPDILWRNTSTGENVIWYMNGAAVSSVVVLPGLSNSWAMVGVGDFNADGKPDILWRNTSTGENVVWYMTGANGASVLGNVSLPTVSSLAWTIAGVGDFNNDTRPDIIWRNTTTGANTVWYMNGTSVLQTVSLPTVSNQAWTIVGR